MHSPEYNPIYSFVFVNFGGTCQAADESVKMMRYLVFIGCCLLVTVACKKKKTEDPQPAAVTPQLKLTVQPVFGAQNLYIDSTYTTQAGWDIQFTDIKFYITDLGNGSNQLVDAARYDYTQNGTQAFQVDGDYTQFSSLSGNIGVPASINHNDPSAFPATSPLNILNANGMHWGWNTGFIFIIIEGRADTIPDGNPLFDHSLTYHVGTDAYLGTVNFPTINWTAASSTLHTTLWQLDMKHIIDHPTNPIDIRSEYITHSSGSQATLTQKVLSNFLDALTAP